MTIHHWYKKYFVKYLHVNDANGVIFSINLASIHKLNKSFDELVIGDFSY